MVRKIGTHTEVVVIKPPKKKTTCIYLDENRICRCKKSARYTEKCFEATLCTYKVKGKYQFTSKKKRNSSARGKKSASTTEKIILNDEQTLLKTQLCKIGKTVYHTRYGKGEVISYSEIQIAVIFDIGEKILDLDTVVYNGYLSLSD